MSCEKITYYVAADKFELLSGTEFRYFKNVKYEMTKNLFEAAWYETEDEANRQIEDYRKSFSGYAEYINKKINKTRIEQIDYVKKLSSGIATHNMSLRHDSIILYAAD